MSKHELKILPNYFTQVQHGYKQFEIRKDDRDFKVGDTLILKEWEDDKYTGCKLIRQITYKLTAAEFEGISPGYCVLGIR